MLQTNVSDLGEKKIIEQIIKPLFNPNNDPYGIGDDCAIVECNNDEVILFSTDRVPADLIAFKLGLIDYYNLGKYLAHLNLSDVAASGGIPLGLLLNLGLPSNLLIADLQKLLDGVKDVIDKFDCKVLGGDITASVEISISATSIGKVQKGKQLTRGKAVEGDLIFVSRPIGMTPTAFEYFCNLKPNGFLLQKQEEALLVNQFTDMYPLCNLGQLLSSSGYCTSCIDNTDGLGQSLFEISQSSDVSMYIDCEKVKINDLTRYVWSQTEYDLISFAFGAGADFSLIGTLSGKQSEKEYLRQFKEIAIIGEVKKGKGVFLKQKESISGLIFQGWNYFTK